MKLKIIITTLILFLAISLSADATPVIIDIEGIIYELDSVTPIWRSVNVSLTNINTSLTTYLVTSENNPSRFRISVGGEETDTATLKVWNREHESSINITPLGIIKDQSMTLNMTLQNYAPEFLSSPIAIATEKTLYTYTLDVIDYNLDAMTITLVQSPSNMTLIGQTLYWTPNQSDVTHGPHEIIINATDGEFTTSTNFTINVANVNDAPQITSEPTLSIEEGDTYAYQIIAEDPDLDNLTYNLSHSPDEMTINMTTGMITWDTGVGDQGSYVVTISVSDNSTTATQEYLLFINPTGNQAPVIISTPSAQANLNTEYTYTIIATDAEDDERFYEIINPPDNSYMEGNVFHWVPSIEDYIQGVIRLVAKATDINYATTCQIFYVEMTNTTTPTIQQTGDGSRQTITTPGIGGISESSNSSGNYYIGEKISDTNTTIFDYHINDEYIASIRTFFEDESLPMIFYQKIEQKPKEIISPDNYVYGYFYAIFENRSENFLISIIEFSIDNDFIMANNLTEKDVVLLSLVNGSWQKLDTSYETTKGNRSSFNATTRTLGYFAISFSKKLERDTAFYKASPTYDSTGILAVSGKIYKDNRISQVKRQTRYIITNKNTSQKYKGYTGIIDKKDTGSFRNEILAKEGDYLVIEVFGSEDRTYEETIRIKRQEDMNIKIYTDFPSTNYYLYLIGAVAIILIGSAFVKKKSKEIFMSRWRRE